MFRFIIIGAFGLCVGCAAKADPDIIDPWAKYNHPVFSGNRAVDEAMFEPVAKQYKKVTPEPVRTGLDNFLSNLRAPTDLLNNVLQGNSDGALATIGRFGINTTIGLAGIMDPAVDMGLQPHKEDFGQTLAVWGVGPGPYLVLPFFGPSNPRDATGLVVDVVTHPLFLVSYPGATIVQLSRFSANSLAQRTAAIELLDNLQVNSLDEYASYRSLYEQSRADAIHNGRLRLDALPDFDEFDEFDDE